MPRAEPSARPPAVVWVIAGAIALLRALPFLWSRVAPAVDGSVLLELGFVPKDFLQYVAFVRQAAEDGAWLLIDPFTTQPQDARIIAPFFVLIGKLAGLTGASPSLALELARIPLLFAFFGVLWWFLGRFFAEPRQRTLACLLVGLSGGIETVLRPLARLLPAESWRQFEQATWQMNGWSSFAAFYNPLWIAGSIGVLLALGLVFDRARPGPRSLAGLAVVSFALFWIHPYSAVAAFVIIAALPIVALAAGERPEPGRWLGILAALLPAVAAIALITLWQREDAVYRAASGGALGAQQLSPFWYPLVFGGLCVLGLRGARLWARGENPLRFVLLGWLVAVVGLHTSSLLNGYHFASQLHVPLCILATPALAQALVRARSGSAGARTLLVVTFAAPLLLTADSLLQLPGTHAVPQEFEPLVADLARRPPGHVLSSAKLGNVVPAYTPHRVYVGHHFLTPDHRARSEEVRILTSEPGRASALLELVRREHIRYVVLPSEPAAAGIAALMPLTREQRRYGRLTLLELR